MAEVCPFSPLLNARPTNGTIPDVCWRQCEDRWENTSQMGVDGSYDFYNPDPTELQGGKDCTHENTDTDFSSENIRSAGAGGTALRSYVVIDECVPCGTEYGEQGYFFECPFN